MTPDDYPQKDKANAETELKLHSDARVKSSVHQEEDENLYLEWVEWRRETRAHEGPMEKEGLP